MTKIFISYRRQDTGQLAPRIFDQLKRHFGKENVFIDIESIPYGTNFRGFLEKKVQGAAVLLALIGHTWDEIQDENGRHRIKNPRDFVRRELETALKWGVLVIPVLVDGAPVPKLGKLPKSLRTLRDLNAAPLDSGRDFEIHVNRLIQTIQNVIVPFGGPGNAIRAQVSDAPILSSIRQQVDTARLPLSSAPLVGRKEALLKLNSCLTAKGRIFVSIIAPGGTGKTALVDAWLGALRKRQYHDFKKVFAWSFYSQGSHSTLTNSQQFFDEILAFFGIDALSLTEMEKARALSRCIQRIPSLIILDGLEPLQYAPTSLHLKGELRDNGLREFINCCRHISCRSLVILTSRQNIVELASTDNDFHQQIILGSLEPIEGAELLAYLGVRGTAESLKVLSGRLGGHALSILLCGHILREYHAGAVEFYNTISLRALPDEGLAEKDSRHALRVLRHYDSLQDEYGRRYLRLLSLLDRPMDAQERAELIQKSNHGRPLKRLSEFEWETLEEKLEALALLTGRRGRFRRLEWDTHPIIRTYYGEQFRNEFPDDFRQANDVLFQYYADMPELRFPDNIVDMMPLFRAVTHGCLAGKVRAAYLLYEERICRHEEYFSQHALGAYSQELTALGAFFPNGWASNVAPELDKRQQAWVYAETSFCLATLGRLRDAIGPRLKHFQLFREIEDWENAARASQNLTDMYVSLGQLTRASVAARNSVRYADMSGAKEQRIRSYSCLGLALHHGGKLRRALRTFSFAELIAKKAGYKYLDRTYGAEYNHVLLDSSCKLSAINSVIARSQFGLNAAKHDNHLLAQALYCVSLIKARLYLDDIPSAISMFNDALSAFDRATAPRFLPSLYLLRARIHLTMRDVPSAKSILNEISELITRCDLRIAEIEHLLLSGISELMSDNIEEAAELYREAKSLSISIRHLLFDVELNYLAASIADHKGGPALMAGSSTFFMDKAQARMIELELHGAPSQLRLYTISSKKKSLIF